MKLHTMKATVRLLVFSAALMVLSCKGKEENKEVNTTTKTDTIVTYEAPKTETTTAETVSESQVRDATKISRCKRHCERWRGNTYRNHQQG